MESSHQLIDQLYMEILGRPADPSGMLTYSKLLTERGPGMGYAEIVKSLLASGEYFNRLAQDARLPLAILGPVGNLQISGKKVAHIISLGTHCLTSFLLKKYGLKPYSLPFDWLFSSPEAIIHCLEDDFATFLDPQYYFSVTHRRETKEPGADHLYYRRECKVGDMFAHRDPSNHDDYHYTVRTVERFRRLLLSDDAKLFLMISRPEHRADSAFPFLSKIIRNSTCNSAFICIQLREPTGQTGCHLMKSLGGDECHRLYEFTPSSKELGVGFNEPIDDLLIMRLVTQFALDLKLNQ